ncbi:MULTISPECIES: hypothetical protein [unclassified Janthinobacterium]|uniref:hypothetical protein n=1 Tax=unclassified Janthinobacterium TaxID=2610881 RepID=UPI001E5EAD94|nr:MULTISPECIES: hypothetical protein [unclassified Janthinobacterium]
MAIEPGSTGVRFPPPFIYPGALLSGLAAERFERAVALAIPYPLTVMSQLTFPAQLRRSWYMGLLQLSGSGWVATTRDLALQAELQERLRTSMPAPL